VHNIDKDSDTGFNRQILSNSGKRKAMEDLCERTRKLIRKELQSQDLDTLTYMPNIRGSIHKAHFSQLLLLLPTNTEDTHEAVSAVQVLTTAKVFCLLMARQEIL
jgi:hypothetical protein